MILSAGDIVSRLGSDPVIRSLAKIRIIDGRPPLEAGAGVVIYVSRYPKVGEFEATWNVWIIDFDNEPLDVVIRQIRGILPDFTILEEGAIIKASTTELVSDRTEVRPENKPVAPDPVATNLNDKFEELRQSIEDRMLLVRPGRPGKDGTPGRDGLAGKDGKDGQDLVATDAELGDLKDVFIEDAKRGQFLMFDGASWIARFVPQILKSGGGGGGIEEAPKDGNFYVRQDGQWVNLADAISSLFNLDAGDFTTGIAETTTPTELNGGEFSP